MIGEPRMGDLRLILSYIGKTVMGVAILMLLPCATAALAGEWFIMVDFLLGFGLALSLGLALAILGVNAAKPSWRHGLAAAALSWLAATAIAAVPYWLSGQFESFLDALFDAMSGFTTTGLVLMLDLDHASVGITMWRMLITFVGGQGIIVLALSFLIRDTSGGYKLYVGEAKDERLFPSVLHTAKAIWKISIIYLAIGTVTLGIAGLSLGLEPGNAFLHGLWMYMSAWSTGGFAPMSQNVLYYHSALYESLTMLFFILGSFNFALHHAALNGKRRELFQNLETASFAITLSIAAIIACSSLLRSGVYADAAALFRKGFYLLISGHTTTGLQSVYARQFVREWGDAALMVLVVVMLVGGSACSTAGGLKGLRLGLIATAVSRETRRFLAPPSAVLLGRYWYHGKRILDDDQLRGVFLVAFFYGCTFALVSLAGVLGGYPFLDAVFEGASVTGNVGLSIGLTTPSMPDSLKVVYILAMWVGRLEFSSVFAALGFGLSCLRRHR